MARSRPLSLWWAVLSTLLVAGITAATPIPASARADGAVTAAAPLAITTTRLPSGEAFVAYSTQLGASGGTAPYRWSVVNDRGYNLLSATTGGLLTANPTVSATHEVGLTVRDAAGASVSVTLPWEVVDPLASTTTSLPVAYRGTEWGATLTTYGGRRPVTWALASGSLPPGIEGRNQPELDSGWSYLMGTPTATGTWSFTLRATDADGRTVTQALTLTVVEPRVPDAPSIRLADGNRVVWSWPMFDGGAPVTGYAITPYLDGVAQAPVLVEGKSTTDWFLPDLQRAGRYSYTVAARNRVGTGPASERSEETIVVGPPDAPTDVHAVAGDRSAIVSWTAPFDGGLPIESYQVDAVASVGLSKQVRTAGPETSIVVTGLTPGVDYTFGVRVYLRSGPVSAPSNTVRPYGPAQKVTGVEASPHDRSAVVRWTPSARDNGSAITAYRITPWVDGVASAPFDAPASATEATVPGLVNGTSYTFTVAAVNAAGPSLASDPSNPVTVVAVAVGPSAPRLVTAVPRAGGAQVSWTAPASDGGAPVTGYVVTPHLGATALTPRVFSSTALTQTVTGLADGATYTYRVAAVNAAGAGTPSDPTDAVTAGAPSAPTDVVATPGATSVLLRWTAPSANGAPITASIITPYRDGVAQSTIRVEGAATSFRIASLERSRAYTFQVRAENARGLGPSSAASAMVRPASPLAPTTVKVVPGATSAVFTWNAPGPDDEPVNTYAIVEVLESSTKVVGIVFGPATTGTVTGLAPGPHRFQIVVFGTQEGGATSAVTAPVVVGLPGSPTNLSVVAGNGSARVSGSAAPAGGGPITGYWVTPYLGTVARTPRWFPGAGTTWTVTGLTNGSAYSFRVTAVNAYGSGPVAAAPAVRVGAPVAPGTPAAAGGRKQATVHWNAPANNGAKVTRYVVTPYIGTVAQPARTFDASTTRRVLTGLRSGVTYTFKVQAVNSRGTGAASRASGSVRVS